MLKHSDFLEVIVPTPSSLACISFEVLQDQYKQLKAGQKTWRDWQELLIAEILVRFWLSKKWDEAQDLFRGNKLAEILLNKFLELSECREKRGTANLKNNHSQSLKHLEERVRSYLECDGNIITIIGEKNVVILPFKLQEKKDITSNILAVDSNLEPIPNCNWGEELEAIRTLLKNKFVRFLCSFNLITRNNEEIGGNSLLLPIALAANKEKFSGNDQTWKPLEIIATGGMNKLLEITPVSGLDHKAKFAQTINAKLFVSPQKTDNAINQISCDGKSIITVQDQIKNEFERYSREKTKFIEINVIFKLVYDLGDTPTVESLVKNRQLNKFDIASETNYLYRLVSKEIYKNFDDSFLFEESPEFDEKIPCVRKVDLSFLKPHRKKYVYIGSDKKPLGKTLFELFEIDFVPCPKNGKTYVGLSFRPSEDRNHKFEEYHRFIKQRRFGKLFLTDQNGKKHPGELTISKLLKGIKTGLKNSNIPSLNEIIKFQNESLPPPTVFQYILSKNWNELHCEKHFDHGLSVLTSLHRNIKTEPKVSPMQWKHPAAIDTCDALHNEGFLVWANGNEQFNYDRKPEIFMKSYYFLWLMSIVGREKKLKDLLSILPHKYSGARREVLRKCHAFFHTKIS